MVETDVAGLDIASLAVRARHWRETLAAVKRRTKLPGTEWYPYDIMANADHLAKLLGARHPDLFARLGGPIADFGAADGDLGFFLASCGLETDLFDWPQTNANGMRAIRALKAALGAQNGIYELDLDRDFELPRPRYALILLLGTLYHLKNPFHVLERLARMSDRCLVSTKIARFSSDRTVELARVPVAYLLDERECNSDPTNFWIFSEMGFRRIASRTGWRVAELMAVGNSTASDPASAEGDERIFALLEAKERSR